MAYLKWFFGEISYTEWCKKLGIGIMWWWGSEEKVLTVGATRSVMVTENTHIHGRGGTQPNALRLHGDLFDIDQQYVLLGSASRLLQDRRYVNCIF